MTLLKNRLPARREIFLIFALCFVITYSWSSLAFFNYLPGWMLFLDGWTIAGIFAYSQVFALFESLLVLAGLLLAAALLPRRLFRERFVAQGLVMVVLAAAAAAALHFLKLVPLWPSKTLLGGLLAYLLGVVAFSWLIQHSDGFRQVLEAAADRLAMLLYLYLPFVAISLVIILARNIF